MKSPAKKSASSDSSKASKPDKAKRKDLMARNKEREMRIGEFTIRLTAHQQASFQEAVVQFASLKFPNRDVENILLPFVVDPTLDELDISSRKLVQAKELLEEIGIPWALIDSLRVDQESARK